MVEFNVKTETADNEIKSSQLIEDPTVNENRTGVTQTSDISAVGNEPNTSPPAIDSEYANVNKDGNSSSSEDDFSSDDEHDVVYENNAAVSTPSFPPSVLGQSRMDGFQSGRGAELTIHNSVNNKSEESDVEPASNGPPKQVMEIYGHTLLDPEAPPLPALPPPPFPVVPPRRDLIESEMSYLADDHDASDVYEHGESGLEIYDSPKPFHS